MEGMSKISVTNKQHQVSLFFDRNTAAYCDYFETEYISQEILNKIKDKSITDNIFRIQSDDYIKRDSTYFVVSLS